MDTRGLIFDMDGTMVDSIPFHAKSWVEFTRRRGLALDVGELMLRTNGRTGSECMRELFGRDFEAGEMQALIDEKEGIYRELFTPVFTEVAGFRRFHAKARSLGLKTGVGSAGDRHNIAFVFANLELPAPPDAVVGGDEGLAGKPSPDIFLEVARRLELSPAQCIVFEDAPFGIEAARRAGMRAVALLTTHTREQLAGPHVLAQVRDFDELLSTDFLGSPHAANA